MAQVIPPTSENAGATFWRFALAAALFLLFSPLYWNSLSFDVSSMSRTPEEVTLHERVLPALAYGFGRLRHGDLPEWNDTRWAGEPFLANPVNALLQPLNLPYLFMPVKAALGWHASICLFLMGFFAFLFARGTGVRFSSAIAGGLVYACSGAAAAALTRPESASAMAWVPAFFWAVDRSVRIRGAGDIAAASLAGALLMLSGNLGLALAAVAAGMVLGLIRLFAPGEARSGHVLPRLGRLAAIVPLTLGLAAFQLLPTVKWCASLAAPWACFRLPDLAGRAPETVIEACVQMLAVGPDHLPRLAYVGVLTLPLLVVAIFNTQRPTLLWLCFLGLLSVSSAAAGSAAARVLMPLWAFSAAIVGALGLDALLSPGRDARSPRVWGPLLAFIPASCLVLFLGPAAAAGRVLAALLLVALCAAWRTRVTVPIFTALYGVLLLADLSAANHPVEPEGVSTVYSVPSEAQTLAGDGRIFLLGAAPEGPLLANSGMPRGAPICGGALFPVTAAQGYWWRALGAEPGGTVQESDPWQTIASPALLNHLSVRVLAAPAGTAPPPDAWQSAGVRIRLADTRAGCDLYVNDSALPRAYWTPRWRVMPDAKAAIDALSEPALAASGECIVIGMGPEPVSRPADYPHTLFACSLETLDAEHVRLRVDAPDAGIVVFTDSFDPGWQAVLDGLPAEMLRVNGVFRGIAVGKGEHAIQFRYAAPGRHAGLALSLIAAAGCIASVFIARRNRTPGR